MTFLTRRLPLFLALLLPVAAFAQGLPNFSQLRSVGGLAVAVILFFAAIADMGVLVYGATQLWGHHFMTGIGMILGALIGGIIIGYAVVSINSMTGQSVTPSGF